MTTLTDIIPPLACEHGLDFEGPLRTFRGWSILNGKEHALGLTTGAKGRNVSFLAGYTEEMADLTFVVERVR